MILPTKHISQTNSVLGVGATLLEAMKDPITVSTLWDKVRNAPNVGNFERMALGLNLLFVIGAVDYVDGLLIRVHR